MDIQAGDSIINIGCSTGADILVLGEILAKACDDGGGGTVTVVVISKTMISEDERRLDEFNNTRVERGIDITAEFQTGDPICLEKGQ